MGLHFEALAATVSGVQYWPFCKALCGLLARLGARSRIDIIEEGYESHRYRPNLAERYPLPRYGLRD